MLPAHHRKLVAQHQVDERPDHKTLRDEGNPNDIP